MSDITCVLFKPDRMRRDPRLTQYVVPVERPSKAILTGPKQLKTMIDALRVAGQYGCSQKSPDDHDCLRFDIRHDEGYVDVTIIYALDCFRTTDHVMNFLHRAESILNQARIDTVRALSQY